MTGNNLKICTSVVTPTKASGDDSVAPNGLIAQNSEIVPTEIEDLLARKSQNCTSLAQKAVRSRWFTSSNTASLCKVSQRSKTRIGLSTDTLQARLATNDVSQPIVHSSEGSIDDVSPNAVQKAQNSTQEHTIGRSPQFESTGHRFESFSDGVPTSPQIVCAESGCQSGNIAVSQISALAPDLYSVDMESNENVITNSQGSKMLSLEIGGHGFESHCTTAKDAASGATNVPEIQQPLATASGIQTVYSIEGFDSCVNESIAKSPSVNTALGKCDQPCPIYDVNNMAMEEKFINTIIFANQGNKGLPMGLDSPVYKTWQQQVDFTFGFVPLGDQIMPKNENWCQSHN